MENCGPEEKTFNFPPIFTFQVGDWNMRQWESKWPKTVILISKVLLLMNSVKYQLQSIMTVFIFVDKKTKLLSIISIQNLLTKNLKCFTYVWAISLPCSLVLLVAKTQTWRESNLKTFNSPWKLSVGLSRVSKYHSFVAVVVFSLSWTFSGNNMDCFVFMFLENGR